MAMDKPGYWTKREWKTCGEFNGNCGKYFALCNINGGMILVMNGIGFGKKTHERCIRKKNGYGSKPMVPYLGG